MQTNHDVYAELEQWQLRNPYRLVNVSCIGQGCGRFASVEEARAKIERDGHRFIGVEGHDVLFTAPVLL